MVQLVLRDHKETKALPDLKVTKVQLEDHRVTKVQRVLKVQLVLKEIKELRVLLVLQQVVEQVLIITTM